MMPNGPLALSDILSGLPDDADYEAVYAAVMASERGRRFLAEYANRNRHADTQMLVAAIGQVEAVIRGEPSPHASTTARDLIEIAVAIDRIAAAVAADKIPDISAAIERIQDIAFVLHERPVEATLCDTLDAAIREIALARADSGGGARRVTELLDALAARVKEMIGPSMPGETKAAPEKLSVGSSEAAPATKNADAVLFEGVIEFVTPQSGAPVDHEADNDAGPQSDSAETASSLPDGGSGDISASADILSHTLTDEHFSSAASSRDSASDAEPPSSIALNVEQPGDDSSPSQRDPAEEPAVLFDPLPVPSPLASPLTPQPATPVDEAAVPPDSAEVPASIAEPEQPALPQFADAPASRAVPSSPADDPLAAVRALSEEELIALFS
jgi:hypothetical protein